MPYEQRIEALIDHLRRSGFLHDERIARAFRTVPLEEFIPQELLIPELLYADRPQLFYLKSHVNRRTISAPHMIATMLEYLSLKPRDELLMLGSKSGYIAAMASLLCSEGHVFVAEPSEEVLRLTRKNLESTGFDHNVTLLHAHPLTMAGTEEFGKWDKILVPYQVEEVEITPALRQLNEDRGVLFAPIGGQDFQYFTQIIREGDKYYGNRISVVVFSPLEKNMTFLTQHVEYFEYLMKNPIPEAIKQELGLDIEDALEDVREALDEMRESLQKRKNITVIYDTQDARRISQEYMERSNIQARDEDGIDFQIVEAFAIENAREGGGKVRIITLLNQLNLPFEVVKMFLSKSKAGVLEGNLSNPRRCYFKLDPSISEENPLLRNLVQELKDNLDEIKKSCKDQEKIDDAIDMIRYFAEKVVFVESETGISMKRLLFTLKILESQLLAWKEALAGGSPRQELDGGADPGIIEDDIAASLKQLERIIAGFF